MMAFYPQHHFLSLSVLLLVCVQVDRVSCQDPPASKCGGIGHLGISPFCDGPAASNPIIDEFGDVNIAQAEPWLTFVKTYCEDPSSEVYDKVIIVETCYTDDEDDSTPTVVGVNILRKTEPNINATFVVVDEPDQECSSFHLCPKEEEAAGAGWGGTLEENFDYDCSNIEGGTGPTSKTCGHIETTINTDAPTPTPPEPELPDEANKPGQAPDATVFTSSGYDDEASYAGISLRNNNVYALLLGAVVGAAVTFDL